MARYVTGGDGITRDLDPRFRSGLSRPANQVESRQGKARQAEERNAGLQTQPNPAYLCKVSGSWYRFPVVRLFRFDFIREVELEVEVEVEASGYRIR